MSKGLKEQFRTGQISAADALESLTALGAQNSRTGRWFTSKIASKDLERDAETASSKRDENLAKNAPVEHNRKWRRGRGKFALTSTQVDSEDRKDSEEDGE